MAEQDIYLEVYRGQRLLSSIPVVTESSGSYSVPFTVPKIALETPPTGPETWTVKAQYVNFDNGGAMGEASLSVLPLWVDVTDIHFVQVVEAPVYTDWGGTNTYVASGRQFGVRTTYTVYGLDKATGFNPLMIDFSFTYLAVFGSDSDTVQEPITVDPKAMYVDKTITLGPGRYNFQVKMDPDNGLMDATVFPSQSLDKRMLVESVISKAMKNLDAIFIPIDMNLGSFNETMTYKAFVQKQQDFIKDVYPIPESHFIFDTYTLDLPALTVGPIYARRLQLMQTLAYVSVLEGGSKMVAILPNNNRLVGAR